MAPAPEYSVADIKTLSRRKYPAMYASENRRSFTRACVAKILMTKRKASPLNYLQSIWSDDETAQRILKGITTPTSRADFPEAQAVHILPMLAPNAASSKLLALGTVLDLAGLSSILLPFVGGSGRPPQPVFVPEGSPAPVVDLTTNATKLGPANKISFAAAVSNELQQASAESAERIVSLALSASVEQGMDVALFGGSAATSSQPAGLLYNVTPITSSAETGEVGIAEDLGAIADAIGASGISTDDLVFVCTPSLAIKILFLAGPLFQNRVFSSAMLAAGTIVGIAPSGLAVGYTGAVEIETSAGGTLHMESTTPLPIVSETGTVAAPTMSAFQQNLIFLKIKAWCAWAIAPGAVACVTLADLGRSGDERAKVREQSRRRA
jgi:hypothetical protein